MHRWKDIENNNWNQFFDKSSATRITQKQKNVVTPSWYNHVKLWPEYVEVALWGKRMLQRIHCYKGILYQQAWQYQTLQKEQLMRQSQKAIIGAFVDFQNNDIQCFKMV